MSEAISRASGEHDDARALLQEISSSFERLQGAMRLRIVGQQDIIEHLVTALFAGGHALFVGVPGLAKTLLIQTLADAIDLDFNRIQFTPDLMPSDITGTDILEQDDAGRRHFRFVQGPVFSNLLLADEINRTPPKTQAALLQAMQEHHVTAAGKTYPLPAPFHVFATQNPLEQEGTYPLPEAQLDRFMMMIDVPYPSAEDEFTIVRETTGLSQREMKPVLSPEDLLRYQSFVRQIPCPDNVLQEAVTLVRRSRPDDNKAPELVKKFVSYGAGPRAAQHIVLCAKTRAALHGRAAVDREDIFQLASVVMRHRILRNFNAEAEGIGVDDIIASIVSSLSK